MEQLERRRVRGELQRSRIDIAERPTDIEEEGS
ncbi:MAG: hypothetical protein ABUL62_32895 [Myxococcales bacterium]